MNDNTRVFNQDCMEQHHWSGKKHSEETKQKMREAMLRRTNPMHVPSIVQKRSQTLITEGTFAGSNSNNWGGGDKKYRGAGWYQARLKRRAHDNYKCVDCGIHESVLGRSLDVHHIIEFKDGGSNDLTNLVSLCRSCHNKRRRHE